MALYLALYLCAISVVVVKCEVVKYYYQVDESPSFLGRDLLPSHRKCAVKFVQEATR